MSRQEFRYLIKIWTRTRRLQWCAANHRLLNMFERKIKSNNYLGLKEGMEGEIISFFVKIPFCRISSTVFWYMWQKNKKNNVLIVIWTYQFLARSERAIAANVLSPKSCSTWFFSQTCSDGGDFMRIMSIA